MTTKAQLGEPIRVGIFSTVREADQAVAGLLKLGFTKDQITVLCSEDWKAEHFHDYRHQDPAGMHTVKAATIGGTIGAVLGGMTAVVGTVATGGIGLLAGGGAAVWAGGIVGGLVGAMMTRGVEKELANYYDQAVVRGKILVAAEDESENRTRTLPAAEKVLHEAGAEPVALPEG
ncbi:MAG: hypothetical protein HYX69_13160 [Planctomycetia bacterium]|nr:hypothetical protein [Planctomycetia bacterium]